MNSSYIAVTVISLVSFSFSVITLYNILMTSWLLLDDNSFAQDASYHGVLRGCSVEVSPFNPSNLQTVVPSRQISDGHQHSGPEGTDQ